MAVRLLHQWRGQCQLALGITVWKMPDWSCQCRCSHQARRWNGGMGGGMVELDGGRAD